MEKQRSCINATKQCSQTANRIVIELRPPPREEVDVREDLGGVEEDVLLAAGGDVGVVTRPALPDPGHVGVHHPRPPWGRGGGLGWAREGHLGAGYFRSE